MTGQYLRALLAMVWITVSGTASGAQTFNGRVVHVDDGDTVVLLAAGNRRIRIRLASIDAPESADTRPGRERVGQPFADKATRFLSEMIRNKVVDADCPETDRFGREVCELRLNGTSANAEMVRRGWAWANTSGNGRFLRDPSYLQLQRAAQRDRRGLWAGKRPVAPWVWRQQ
jgi:endonuclease YncB( thermonuclease family)